MAITPQRAFEKPLSEMARSIRVASAVEDPRSSLVGTAPEGCGPLLVSFDLLPESRISLAAIAIARAMRMMTGPTNTGRRKFCFTYWPSAGEECCRTSTGQDASGRFIDFLNGDLWNGPAIDNPMVIAQRDVAFGGPPIQQQHHRRSYGRGD